MQVLNPVHIKHYLTVVVNPTRKLQRTIAPSESAIHNCVFDVRVWLDSRIPSLRSRRHLALFALGGRHAFGSLSTARGRHVQPYTLCTCVEAMFFCMISIMIMSRAHVIQVPVMLPLLGSYRRALRGRARHTQLPRPKPSRKGNVQSVRRKSRFNSSVRCTCQLSLKSREGVLRTRRSFVVAGGARAHTRTHAAGSSCCYQPAAPPPRAQR